MAGTLGFPLQLTDPGNYWDLRIVDNDIALDVGRQPLKLADRASIAQDIAHMIRERAQVRGCPAGQPHHLGCPGHHGSGGRGCGPGLLLV